ncbi:MAG: nucleotidyltransferase family protein [Tissierellia bacterium]|nr:nucleotidyltransferase family protein [Tissierellia bacterium]
MKITGIIAEYNPFHNGHKYMIDKFKENGTGIVVIISSSFVQRGEPAIIDKWLRARSAIEAGVDLVIELPYYYSVAPAEIFADGAVKFLDYMGVDFLCFGSEGGNISILKKLGEISSKIERNDSEILSLLKNGLSFSEARIEVIKNRASDNIDKKTLDNTFAGSNNILAIEYISSLEKLNSKIKPVAINRIGDDYSESEIKTINPSATAIRNMLLNGKLKETKPYLPIESYTSLLEHIEINLKFNSLNRYEELIFYLLDNLTIKELNSINFSNSDVINRLLKFRKDSSNLEELLNLSRAKSISESEIKRYLCNLLNNLTWDKFEKLNKEQPSIRVLAMNENGIKILKSIKEKNIVTKFKDFESLPQLIYESVATNNYFLTLNKKRDLDYYYSPIIIN